MKITERRLRQIIRSVIKESHYSKDLSGGHGHPGSDPIQALGPADPENNIENNIENNKVYIDENGDRIKEYKDENGNLWRENLETGEKWNRSAEIDAANEWNRRFPDS